MAKRKTQSEPEPKPEPQTGYIYTVYNNMMIFRTVLYNGRSYFLSTVDIEKINLGRLYQTYPDGRPIPQLIWSEICQQPEIFDFDLLDLSRCPRCYAQGFNQKHRRDDGVTHFCFNCGWNHTGPLSDLILPHIGSLEG